MNFDKYQTKGAYHYDWYNSGEPAWYKKAVDKCVEFCKGSTLDVGCGDGVVSKFVSEKGHKVIGIDNDIEAIKLASGSALKADFWVANIGILPGRKWEYMVCLNVIEHLEKPESVFRIFRDNITKAAIIITDMPQEKPSPYHVKEFTPKELEDLFYPYEVKPFQIDDNFHGIEVWK